MRNLTVRLIIAMVTVIFAFTAAALWLTHSLPPFNRVAVQMVPAQAPVTCCELVQNADHYYSKNTRVKAILLGYHELALYDPACKTPDNYLRADFDSASRKKLVKAIADLNGAGFKEGNFWAEVVLDGRFEKVSEADLNIRKSDSGPGPHKYIKYRFRLVVFNVDSVSALPPDATWPP